MRSSSQKNTIDQICALYHISGNGECDQEVPYEIDGLSDLPSALPTSS